MAPETILKTKLFIPPLREGLVIRLRLISQINEGINKRVLLITAPAGFGKSTLLIEWVTQARLPVAWVELDSKENDPVGFLSYLISGVQSIYPNLGDDILSELRIPGAPPVEGLMDAWINEIAEHATEFALVLDDFHHIHNSAVIELLTKLTEHQPRQLHLLISSRSEMPKPFARIRSRGELLELDIADLRFNQEETAAFLQNCLGSRITPQDAKILGEKTEGWIAGLQMAVLSMRSSKDIHQFIAQFSAQDRLITDYLLDEVLLQLQDETIKFLLATSILERFTAPLCNHLVGIRNSQEIIESLEHSGMFIIPLDTTRTWYRFHHLFAELLRKRLNDSSSFDKDALHRRAFAWFASEEMLEECIYHAFAVNDYDLVIGQIESSLKQIMAQGLFRNYLTWVEKIPQDYLRKKPRLEIVKIFMLHEMGKYEERDRQLEFVNKLLEPLPKSLDECGKQHIINHGILASIVTIIQASAFFHVKNALAAADSANQLLSSDEILWRGLALGAIPFIDRALDNYEKAIKGFHEVLELVLKAEFIFQAFIIYSALSKSYLEIGKLKLAIITCQKAIDLDAKHGANLPFAKLAYLIMADLMYQTGQLDSAESYLDMGLEHVIRHGEVYSIMDGYFTLINIQIARGDLNQGKAMLHEMKAVITGLSPSNNAVRIINALEAHFLTRLGELKPAEKWVNESGFDHLNGRYLLNLDSHTYVGIYRVSQNPIRVYTDFIRMTSARLHLALGKLEDGLTIINQVLKGGSPKGQQKFKIECMLIKSMILKKMEKIPAAVNVLQEAIHLATGEGYVQVFLNVGEEIQDLLQRIKTLELGDIEEQVFILNLLEKIQIKGRGYSPTGIAEMDQLTAREIEVLRCLASGASYFQAADKLAISRNTLKTHTKRIYQKLAVGGLVQALNKAKELKII